MLQIDNITLRIAGRVLMEGASASIASGAKVGLVGRNGSGKTTLFRAISGEIGPDQGEIRIAKGLRVGQVAQEALATDEALIDIVLAADLERHRLLAQANEETDANRIAEIHARLTDIDAHSAEARAAAILAGLGFDESSQGHPVSEFSGGWRMRVALAAILFANPDILLLDEPTNYLDLEGTLWLENYLARYSGTVIVISHDRDLLNVAVNAILHLENRDLTLFRGPFDSFVTQYAQQRDLAQKTARKQAARMRHMQAFVDRFRAKASKAKQAQSRIKMLDKMQPAASPGSETSAPIRFGEPAKLLSSPIIRLENVAAGYEPHQPVLKDLSLRIDQDDRIALLGANGNGKSTFARLLSGRMKHVTGSVTLAPNLKVGLFAQHQMEELVPEQTAVEHVRSRLENARQADIRAKVAQMGLDTARMDTRAVNLSGGEKARLLLGLATLDGPNLVILDEPTNHLDLQAREMLMLALNEYSGAIILISHDRYLIEACADRLWIVRDGAVQAFEGDMDGYRDEILGKNRQSAPRAEPAGASQMQTQKRRNDASRRRQLAPLALRIKATENTIEKLRDTIVKIDDQLSDPDWFARNPKKGAHYAMIRSAAEKKLENQEDEWIRLSDEYENLRGSD